LQKRGLQNVGGGAHRILKCSGFTFVEPLVGSAIKSTRAAMLVPALNRQK
jgi:hypothetical protein